MKKERKTEYLQIRVTPSEKAAITRAAERAKLDTSEYVLSKALSPKQFEFQNITHDLSTSSQTSYSFATLNDFLSRLSREEFSLALASKPEAELTHENANYLAAMVELSAQQKKMPAPTWTQEIPPLTAPVFGTELKKLRMHLLLFSPLAFRRRNIFIDASVGDRV